MHRRLRKAAIVCALVTITLALLIAALVPTIAGSIARDFIAKKATNAIVATVEIDSLHLSWLSKQQIHGLKILDQSGTPVANIDVSISTSLLALVFGSRNFDEIAISGWIRLERDQSGQLTIADATKPTANAQPSSDVPPTIPPTIRARVVLDSLDIEIVENDRSSFIHDLKGSATISAGNPIDLRLASIEIEHAGTVGGSIKLDATIDNWSRADGTLTIDNATIESQLALTDLPSDLARAIAASEQDLAAALGKTFTLTVHANGQPDDLLVDAEFSSPHASASGSARITDDSITLDEPMLASADALHIARAIPALDQAIENAERTIRFDTEPRLSLRLDDLRVPRSAGRLELDQTSATMHIDIPQSRATLVLEGEEHTIELAPAAALATITPENGLSIDASGSATMDGRDAGRFEIAASLANLFDETGTLDINPESLEGFVSIADLDTGLAQPWIDALDLVETLGPTLNARIDIEPIDAGRIASLDLRSEHANASGSLLIEGRHLRSSKAPLTFSIQTEPEVLNTMLGSDPAFRFTNPAAIVGELSDVRIDLDRLAGLRPIAGGAIAGTLHAELADATSITPTRPDGTQLLVDGASIRGSLDLSGVASGSIDIELSHADSPFAARATIESIEIAPLLDRRYATTHLRGSASLENAPTSLLDQLPIKLADARGNSIAIADLVSRTIGQQISASLVFEPDEAEIGVRGSLTLGDLSAQLVGSLTDQSLHIAQAGLVGSLRPRSVQTLLDTFAPTLEPMPRLASATGFQVSLRPLEVNLTSPSIPDRIDATLTLDRADVRGLGLVMAKDDHRFLGPMLIDQTTAELVWTPESEQTTSLELSLQLLNKGEKPIGSITLAASRSANNTSGRATIGALDLSLADRLLKSPGLITGAAGPALNMTVDFDLSQDLALTASLDTARLSTTENISMLFSDDAIEIGPVLATWDIDPAWANTRLPPLGALSLADASPIIIEAAPTILPRADDQRPLRLDARLHADRLSLALAQGQGETLSGLDLHVQTDPDTKDLIRFDALAQHEPKVPDNVQAPNAGKLEASGTLRLARDSANKIDTSSSVLNMTASASNAPIALLDTLLAQDGLLLDLVGDNANAKIIAQNLTADRGGIRLTLETPTTTLALRGRVRDKAFRVRPVADDEPGQISIRSISPQLGARLSEILPLIARIEKSADDTPATVRINRLELPLDADLTKLNANLDLDLGTANFHASRGFTPILKSLDWNIDGAAGRRLKPINLRVRDGLITYKGVKIPLGEFTITLQGSANLTDRTVESIAYLPFASLSSEFAGDIQGQIARILGPLGVAPDLESLQIPIRMTGKMGSPKVELATDLFIDSIRKSFRPEDMLRRGLEDALKHLGGG